MNTKLASSPKMVIRIWRANQTLNRKKFDHSIHGMYYDEVQKQILNFSWQQQV